MAAVARSAGDASSPAARRPSAAGALISRQANQSSNNRTVVRTTLMNINQDPPSSRCAVARARGVFYRVMVMTVIQMEWAVNP